MIDDIVIGQLIDRYTKSLNICLEKRIYIEEHHEDIDAQLRLVASIGEYRDMERELIATIGLDDAQEVILKCKRVVAEIERCRGIVFFGEEVEKLENILAIKHLTIPTPLRIDRQENMDMMDMCLPNDKGEKYHFRTWSVLHLEGEAYIELELLEDMTVGKFNYYHIENTSPISLTLVEDNTLVRRLDERREVVEVNLGKNR